MANNCQINSICIEDSIVLETELDNVLASLNVGEIKALDFIEQLGFDEFGVIHSCFHFVMFLIEPLKILTMYLTPLVELSGGRLDSMWLSPNRKIWHLDSQLPTHQLEFEFFNV